MAENRRSTSSQDDPVCQLTEDRPPSRLSRVSSTSSRFTREDVTLMNDGELDILCKQVFALCDTNGDGFISQEELMAQCGDDDPELLQHLIKSMDTNKNGRISFEEFRSGLDTVSKHLTTVFHSTPATENRLNKITITTTSSTTNREVTLYEHEPSVNEKEEAWLITMDRIDPAGYISNNEELRSVWMDLLTKDSNLLDKFEVFLTNIVDELERSHSDVEEIEKRMKQVLTNHSKEVSEMDGFLDQQLREAYVEQQVKSQQKSDRLNGQYRDLLAERDKLIASLAEQEQDLQQKLVEKVHNEQELRRERLQLLNLNRSLQDQLTDSYKQLSVSQREIQRLSFCHERNEEYGRVLDIDEPLMETSLPLSDYVSTESNQSQSMVELSPPPDPPTSNSTFKSPSLAIEVAEALQKINGDATPTLSRSLSVTPTAIDEDVGEKMRLLDSTTSNEEIVGVSLNDSSSSTKGYVIVSTNDNAVLATNKASVTTPPSSIPISHKPPDPHQPSSTPVNMLYDPMSFTASTIMQTRRDDGNPQPLNASHSAAPSRVFKVVFLGDSGVGKTSLIRRLVSGQFTIPQSTLGLDYNTSVVTVGDEKVVFQLWDTAGQERFQSTTAVYFRRADAFIVVYDVTSKYSFKNIKTWISLVKATLRTDLPVVMLMGNKTDKDEERVVSKEDGRSLAMELRAMFSETSALSGDNVLQAHTTLASLLLERENQDIEDIKRSALRLDRMQQKKRCKC